MVNWIDKKVKTIKPMEKIPIGSTGTVTADLPNEGEKGVFAVWFDNIELQPPWCSFPHIDRDKYFEIIGEK